MASSECHIGRFGIVRSALLVTLTWLVLVTACRGASGTNGLAAADADVAWKDWEVIDVTTQAPVQLNEWIDGLSQYDIVYLGEEHHNPSHIEAALKILRSFTDRGIPPTLALEMFAWDGQAAIDRYMKRDGVSRSEFLEEVRWEQNWGGPFDDYAPLVEFARSHSLALVGMNPPKTLIRSIVRKGLEAVRSDSEWSRWNMAGETIVDDPLYRERIMAQLQQCHGGGAPEGYHTMYEASMVRDEAMAKTLVSVWNDMRSGSWPPGPIVSYTGGGHIQYHLPVPKRVARRLPDQAKQVTIYMASFDPSRRTEIRQLLEDGVADYVWLTPIGQQGPPRRCR